MNFQALHFSSEDEGDESSLSSYDSSEDEFSNDSLKGGVNGDNRVPFLQNTTNHYSNIYKKIYDIHSELPTIKKIQPINNSNIYKEDTTYHTIHSILNKIANSINNNGDGGEGEIVIERVNFKLKIVKERNNTYALTVLLHDNEFTSYNINNFIEDLYDKDIFIFIIGLDEYRYNISKQFHHAHSFMYFHETEFKKFIIYFSTHKIDKIYNILFDHTYNDITEHCNLKKIQNYINDNIKNTINVLFTDDTSYNISEPQYTTIITNLNNNTIEQNYILALLFIFASIEDDREEPIINNTNLSPLYNNIINIIDKNKSSFMRKNWQYIMNEYNSVIIYKILNILQIVNIEQNNVNIISNWSLTNNMNIMKYIMSNHIFNNNRLNPSTSQNSDYIDINTAIRHFIDNDKTNNRTKRYTITNIAELSNDDKKIHSHIIKIIFNHYTQDDNMETLYNIYKNSINETEISTQFDSENSLNA